MKAEEYWQTCGPGYAHLRYTGKHSRVQMHKEFRRLILSHIPGDLKGMSVIDFGVGGGFLGDLLFSEYGIKQYIGIDIALRSLEHAKKNLKGKNCGFHLVPVEFRKLKADALFSFACMQHFPSQEYLDQFLDNINRSGLKLIGVHYRHGRKTAFNGCYGEELGDVGRACHTNADYIMSKLTGYKLYYLSKAAVPSDTQTIVLEREPD